MSCWNGGRDNPQARKDLRSSAGCDLVPSHRCAWMMVFISSMVVLVTCRIDRCLEEPTLGKVIRRQLIYARYPTRKAIVRHPRAFKTVAIERDYLSHIADLGLVETNFRAALPGSLGSRTAKAVRPASTFPNTTANRTRTLTPPSSGIFRMRVVTDLQAFEFAVSGRRP